MCQVNDLVGKTKFSVDKGETLILETRDGSTKAVCISNVNGRIITIVPLNKDGEVDYEKAISLIKEGDL